MSDDILIAACITFLILLSVSVCVYKVLTQPSKQEPPVIVSFGNEPVRSNPPAKQRALAMREKQIDVVYEDFINSINRQINHGNLSVHLCSLYCDNTGKLNKSLDTITKLKAGRKLKAAGFQVKIKTDKIIHTTRAEHAPNGACIIISLEKPFTQITKQLHAFWE